MEDKFSPVLSNIDYNIRLYEDTELYDTVADRILDATDYYTEDSGLVICADKSEAEVAKNILEKDYTVTIKPLGDSEYDLQYHVMFERPFDEEYKDLKFMSNKGTPGTLVGEVGGLAGGSMGESYEEPEEDTECPYCGGKLVYDSGQGKFQMYRCDGCHQWVFLTKDNEFKSEDEVADDFLTEAKEDDSFRDAQNYYDSLITDDQQVTINSLTHELENIGAEAEVEQLIPTKDSNSNITFRCYIRDPEMSIDEYQSIIEDILESFESENIKIKGDEINTPKYKYKIWGFCNIDGMTLHESDNLDEAEIHDTLNPDLWDGEELKPEVKDKLLEIADKFKQNLEENDIKLDIKDIVIVGSNSQYNYTDKSDIDLHLLVDLSVYPNQEELAAKLYDARKSIWNDKYDPTIYGHPVEIYVEPYKEQVTEEVDLEEAISKGIYSLYNGWVSKSEPESADIPDVSQEFENWVRRAERCETEEDIDNYLDEIYQIRQDGLLSSGEFSDGNVLFKELRDNNILDNLKAKKVDLLNQEMSL